MENKSTKLQKTRLFLLKRIFPEKKPTQVSLKILATYSSISPQFCPVDATTGLKMKTSRVLLDALASVF